MHRSNQTNNTGKHNIQHEGQDLASFVLAAAAVLLLAAVLRQHAAVAQLHKTSTGLCSTNNLIPKLPTSGSEPTFTLQPWKDGVEGNNCYDYALNDFRLVSS